MLKLQHSLDIKSTSKDNPFPILYYRSNRSPYTMPVPQSPRPSRPIPSHASPKTLCILHARPTRRPTTPASQSSPLIPAEAHPSPAGKVYTPVFQVPSKAHPQTLEYQFPSQPSVAQTLPSRVGISPSLLCLPSFVAKLHPPHRLASSPHQLFPEARSLSDVFDPQRSCRRLCRSRRHLLGIPLSCGVKVLAVGEGMIGLSFCPVAVPVVVKIMVGTRLVGLLPEVFL